MSLLTRLRKFVARYAFVASRLLFALTIGLVRRRQRSLLWRFGEEMGFTECEPVLPVVPSERFVNERLPVVLRELAATDGNVSERELVFLAQLVRTRQPRRIFEIGTFDGRTTLALAANAPEDALVYTLDLPSGATTALELAPFERKYVDKPASGARVHGSDLAGKVRQLFGDSATFDFSPYAAELMFIDGSHAYEYVLRDSRAAQSVLGTGGGTIVWHDYGVWAGVTRALNELHQQDPVFAPIVHIEGTTLALLTIPPQPAAGQPR